MRISSVSATDLLSFERLDLEMDAGTSVIVGPNGGGKTNLTRLLRLAVAAVRAVSTSGFGQLDSDWDLAGRYEGAEWEARIGMVFDHDQERSLIEDWARSAVVTSLKGNAPQSAQGLDRLLATELGAADVLGRGELVVRREPSRRHPWVVTWQTHTPVARLDLWQRHALLSGPAVVGEVAPSASGDLLQMLVASPDGKPLAPLTEDSDPELIGLYAAGLGGFTFAQLLDLPSPVELMARRGGTDPELPSTQRLLAWFPELQNSSRDHLSFAHLLDRLLSSSLIITANHRAPLRTTVPLPGLAGASDPHDVTGIEDGSGTAVELLRLKNGTAAERARFRSVQELFTDISGRRLDVRQHPVTDADEQPALRITPVVVDMHEQREFDIPLQLSGAGNEEAALLAVLLTEDRHSLVLDEPATNLSPLAQHRLLRVLRERRRGQTILITHSAHLVPVHDASDLRVVTRLTRSAGCTTAHRPRLDQRTFDELKELLRQSQIRDVLFAAGVVLVEGPTDVDVFEVWLAQAEAHGLPTPESTHVVFISVGGDERFPKFAQLMIELGVPYAIVADGPAFRPGGALSKLAALTHAALPPDEDAFESARKHWEAQRVRTVAIEFGVGERKGHGEIEALLERVDPAVWAEVSGEAGPKLKALLGFRFAHRVPVPTEVLTLWRGLLADLILLE